MSGCARARSCLRAGRAALRHNMAYLEKFLRNSFSRSMIIIVDPSHYSTIIGVVFNAGVYIRSELASLAILYI